MTKSQAKKISIIFIFAFIGWALCGSVVGIGRAFLSMENTLILHAVLVPIIFSLLSLIYFKYFHFTTPLLTAIIFVASAILLDIFIVSIFIEKSFEMFKSILGTWLPFSLIFIATYQTGAMYQKYNINSIN